MSRSFVGSSKHQDVRRFREQPGQQQPAPLAAGEELDQAARPLGREQEVLQVAEDVPVLAVDRDRLVLADVLLDGLLLVERGLELVEVGDLEVRPVADRPGPGLEAAEQELEQRRLARAVGADDPHLVAPHDRGGQVADDRREPSLALAVAEADALGLDDQAARAVGLLDLHPGGALAFAALAAGLAHGLERPDAALVAGAAGLDSLANPDLFLRQLLVEEGRLPLLGGEELLLALEERRVVAGPVVEAAAVELGDPGGQPAEERAVVGDEDQRAAVAEQEVLEPADRLDVQVVGRLVEQEDIGVGDEGPRQQDAPLHPRGERREGAAASSPIREMTASTR